MKDVVQVQMQNVMTNWLCGINSNEELRITPRLGTWAIGRIMVPLIVTVKFESVWGLGGKIINSVLDMLSLRCLWDIYVENCSRHLVI